MATIGTTDADFLGYTISSAGVMPNAQKVEALTKNSRTKRPETATLPLERNFLLQEILRDLSKRMRSITSFLKQGVKFVFTPVIEAIVRELLAELTTPPVLVDLNWDTVLDNSRPFFLYCNPSMDGYSCHPRKRTGRPHYSPHCVHQLRYHRV